jgi:predicted unusual protein kinase regulating ubiquinone biosynthesis (AarF/ABC1/UbiB family)
MKRAWSNLHRFVRIFWICFHHLLVHFVTNRFGRYRRLRGLPPGERYSGAQRLREALQEIGGTFIKFGQVLALQSDLLPLEYCKELFGLLDQVPPFPFADVEEVFLREFGRRPQEIYDSFERDPIATGSIAQVHVATLGIYKLAVKVRRPSVLTDFGSDIRLMTLMVKLITTLRLKLLYWMIAPTTEFVTWTQDELDFRREARYMDTIAKNAVGNPREAVPRVLWEYTRECILTTDFMEAMTVLDYMRARETRNLPVLRRLESIAFDPDTFARNLIDNFLGDAFQYGMFHADLHPANLMIMPSNRVGYIDFGIAGVLSTYSRQHLVAMTLAYARGDLNQMCDSFFRVSAMDNQSHPDMFRAGLKEMSKNWYVRNGDGVNLRRSITAIMLELLTLSRATGIWPQRDVVKYIRSAIALDGLIKSLAPGFNVGQHLEAACDHHLHWHSLWNLMSPDTMLGWLEAGSRMARDGMSRAIRMMGQLGSTPTRVAPSQSGKAATFAVVRISSLALLFSIAAAVSPGTMNWGLNLRSASVGLTVVAGMLAVWRMLATQKSTHGVGGPARSGSEAS